MWTKRMAINELIVLPLISSIECRRSVQLISIVCVCADALLCSCLVVSRCTCFSTSPGGLVFAWCADAVLSLPMLSWTHVARLTSLFKGMHVFAIGLPQVHLHIMLSARTGHLVGLFLASWMPIDADDDINMSNVVCIADGYTLTCV